MRNLLKIIFKVLEVLAKIIFIIIFSPIIILMFLVSFCFAIEKWTKHENHSFKECWESLDKDDFL
jgi:hypothetical protein